MHHTEVSACFYALSPSKALSPSLFCCCNVYIGLEVHGWMGRGFACLALASDVRDGVHAQRSLG